MDRELRVVPSVIDAAAEVFLSQDPRTVLLTGGRTPKLLYERLATTSFPWPEVDLFLSDERCVQPEDQRSNGRMIRETLANRVPARFHPMDGEGCAPEAYERTLAERMGDAPRFDLALYGLGPDGHTASLFPGRPEVDEADRWVVHVPEAGWEPFVPRLSLTVPVLSAARLGVFLVEGEEKREPLRRLLDGDDIPAARLHPDGLLILADRRAAGP